MGILAKTLSLRTKERNFLKKGECFWKNLSIFAIFNHI